MAANSVMADPCLAVRFLVKVLWRLHHTVNPSSPEVERIILLAMEPSSVRCLMAMYKASAWVAIAECWLWPTTFESGRDSNFATDRRHSFMPRQDASTYSEKCSDHSLH